MLERDEVIRIEKDDILPPAGLHAEITRCRRAAVPSAVQEMNAYIPRFIGRRDSTAAICRAVIHEQRLKILKALRQQTVEAV